MTLTVGHRHHTELLPHLDELRVLADGVQDLSGEQLRGRLAVELTFIDEQLIPHMEMAERNLYPELERLLEDSRAMGPMRREHVTMRRLVTDARAVCDRLPDGTQKGIVRPNLSVPRMRSRGRRNLDDLRRSDLTAV